MADVITVARQSFGQNVTLLSNTKTSLMSGAIKIKDLSTLTGTTINIIVVKKNVSDSQTREGRFSSQTGYILFEPSLTISEEDVIITQNEYFYIHEVSLKNNGITGSILTGPAYKRAEIEIYSYI